MLKRSKVAEHVNGSVVLVQKKAAINLSVLILNPPLLKPGIERIIVTLQVFVHVFMCSQTGCKNGQMKRN